MSRKKVLIAIIMVTVIIVAVIIIFNPNDRYKKITVSEAKWNNIINSKSENKNLVLEDIKFNDYNLIIDESNNNLYYSLIKDSNNKYNPNVSYISQDKNAKIAILSDEITDEKVKSNHQFKIMIYNDNQYHIYNLVCTELPILNIKYNEEENKNNKKIPMELYLIDNLTDSPNKVVISNGKIKKDGDKYIFSLNMTTPGKNIRENRKSILNMKPNSEYVLNKIEDGQEKNPRQHQVMLFINGEYKGVYYISFLSK